MKNELITDLLPRLEHGVLVETTKWQNNGQGKPMSKAVGKLIGYSERTGFEVVFNEEDFAEDFDKVKPILFNSLTEPITIAGKTFVPIVELLKQLSPNAYTFTIKLDDLILGAENIEGHTLYFKSGVFTFTKGMGNVSFNQLELFDLLHQWHCNYRLGESEFIAATNEYA